MERGLFRAVGGFKPIPLMEDYDLVERLRRVARPALVPGRVATSDRRWREVGVVRTTLLNQGIVLAWKLGVGPDRLAEIYYSTRGRRRRRPRG